MQSVYAQSVHGAFTEPVNARFRGAALGGSRDPRHVHIAAADRPAASVSGGYPKRPVMYCSVRGSRGVEKITSVGPSSINSPSSMNTERSEALVACCML